MWWFKLILLSIMIIPFCCAVCIENRTLTIRKCCPDGQAMFNKTCLASETKLHLRVYEGESYEGTYEDYCTIHENFCITSEKYMLMPLLYEEDKFFLQKNGQLFMPKAHLVYRNLEEYCLENIIDINNGSVSALICINDAEAESHISLSIGGYVIFLFSLEYFLRITSWYRSESLFLVL